jgi:hypothetical protein
VWRFVNSSGVKCVAEEAWCAELVVGAVFEK